MRPVRPSKIAGVIAQDFHGAQLARSISRIKNELRMAFRPGGNLLGGRLLFLSLPFHFRAGLGRKQNKVRAREKSITPAMTLSEAAALRRAMESQRTKIPSETNATVRRIANPLKALMFGTSPSCGICEEASCSFARNVQVMSGQLTR